MTNLLPVQSQRDFLLEAVTALAKAGAGQETAMASSLLNDCLTALVVEEMKQLVRLQARAGYYQRGALLNQALNQVERLLHSQFAWEKDRVPKWNWRQVRETLKHPASCLEALQANLVAANREHCLPEEQRVTEGTEVPFDILVLMDYETEGLVVTPVEGERCYLNLGRVRAQEGWIVAGNSYPFEVTVGDFTCIILDTGEVMLQTRNFPASLIQEARQRLILLAQCLYTKGPQQPFVATISEPEEPQNSLDGMEPDDTEL